MGIWEWFFPVRCVGCRRQGDYLCGECVNRLQVRVEMICPECGKGSIGGGVHSRCQKRWGMDGLVAGMKYWGIMRQVISRYKYRYVSELTETLIEMMLSVGGLERLPDRNWVVVGVPLHPRRERWRGFNQADMLAQGLAQSLGRVYIQHGLERRRYTKSQMTLARKERLTNLVGAFGKGENFEEMVGESVLLVDDVWTTGATMRECTKVLKRGGVTEVWGLVVAR